MELSLLESNDCLKELCRARLPSLGSEAREGRVVLGLFLSVLIVVSWLLASSLPSLGSVGPKGAQGAHDHVVPRS